jgi:hypothetical protein
MVQARVCRVGCGVWIRKGFSFFFSGVRRRGPNTSSSKSQLAVAIGPFWVRSNRRNHLTSMGFSLAFSQNFVNLIYLINIFVKYVDFNESFLDVEFCRGGRKSGL